MELREAVKVKQGIFDSTVKPARMNFLLSSVVKLASEQAKFPLPSPLLFVIQSLRHVQLFVPP